MRRHRGQVALPGGKRDATDTSGLETALRESEEEVGFSREAIDVLGGLRELSTTTGFVVTPFVGWLHDDVTAHPNPDEIARAFCVPLSEFGYPEPRPRLFRGRGLTRIAPSYLVDGELVWGATAKIIGELASIVRSVLSGQSSRSRQSGHLRRLW